MLLCDALHWGRIFHNTSAFSVFQRRRGDLLPPSKLFINDTNTAEEMVTDKTNKVGDTSQRCAPWRSKSFAGTYK